MDDEHDVVVVGAGPAGLQFAREVAARWGGSVAVLERNERLRDNDKSTGGTFGEVVDGFDVPNRVIYDETDSVTVEGPTASARLDVAGYVLDFPRFLEFLGEDAAANGAAIHTGTTVTGPIVEGGTVRGVRCVDATSGAGEGEGERQEDAGNGERGRGEREVRARLTVDATGPNATLASALGCFDPDAAQRGIGLEFEAEGDYETGDTMLFRFDHEVAPGGYAWTFPAGEGAFKAGVCWVDDFRAVHGDGGSIREYVERWAETDPRWSIDRIRAVHAGEVRSDNSINRRAADGFLAVGDAVSSINPLFGEGIRPGMESAAMAADVAVDALRAGDVSRERLHAYERRWNERKGRDWKRQRIVGELLYDFDADQQDAFIERLDDLSEEATERLRTYSLSVADLARLYPFRPGDLRKVPRLLRHV